MSNRITFTVTNRLTENTGQNVFVFMTSRNDSDTNEISHAAWQTLNPAANGGRQSFTFSNTLELTVQNSVTKCLSETVRVKPNQLYTVTNDDNQGPVLHLANTPPLSARVVAVTNTTDPDICLRSIWSVANKPVVIQNGLNHSTTATFELIPTIFFLVADPSRGGGGWVVEQFSDEFVFVVPGDETRNSSLLNTGYQVPAGVTDVQVTWSRPNGFCGADVLTFDPPSAPVSPAPGGSGGFFF